MKRYFQIVFLLAPLAAWGDDRFDHRRDRDYGRSRDARYEREGPNRRWSLDRVRRDLQSIWSRSRVDGHEAGHFREALDDLRNFEERAARGRFDRGRLSSAIHNVDHLADARQLHPRDRAILRQHLYALQQLQDGPQNAGWYRR